MWPRFKMTGNYNQSYPLYPYEEPYENNNIAVMCDQIVRYMFTKRNYLIKKI